MVRTASCYNYVKSKPIPNFDGWFAREDGFISNPYKKTIRGSLNKDGYCCYIDPGGGQHYIHRLVAKALVHNPNPTLFTEVDHKNGLRHDNRASNLRWANRTIQNLNRSFRGWKYYPRSKKYSAQCIVCGVKYKIGSYKTAAEAHKAYVDFKNAKIEELYTLYLKDEDESESTD